ncbi:MAG: patatin-like phospholipase family protein [Gammaproteobacteria bacterium]|nr:patatin-like phospholipase family protein [Gammaproteobacteria bacterium]
MNQMTRILPASVLALLSMQGIALGQPHPGTLAGDESRPRIGLVLGGGGARGAAHIGVLRELERQRIPVDAIAGTSMGAIVGGLYAAGVSVDELEQVVQSIDWYDAFADAPGRQDLRFRRKQDDEAFPIRFTLGIRDGEVQLPKGLIQGQKLGLILRELTIDAAAVRDFDELPIPFRAVASDIATGEMVELAEGDLALSMRASMSAPGIFAPVVVDGRTLVDGGLVGNVPVDTIRDMGVDIVIAVDVEFPLYEPEQLASALDITAQMLTVLIRKETRRQLATLNEQDFLIRPDLGQFGSTNFGEIVEAIEPGATATAAEEAGLARYSLDPESYARYQARRDAGLLRPGTLDFVEVRAAGPLSPRVLEARLTSKPGDPVDSKRLARDANAIYGMDQYEHVDYRLASVGDRTGVVFDARPKSWGPNFLQFGVSMEDDFEGATEFNMSARLTRMGLNSRGAEWRSDLQLGTEPYFTTEFYQPLSFDSRYFVAPRFAVEQRNVQAFADEFSIARYRVSEGDLGVDAGRELGNWGELRVGAFRGRGHAAVKVGDPGLPTFDFDTGGFFARLAVDTLDDAQIPRHGLRADLEWRGGRPSLGDDVNSDSVETDISLVRTFGRHTWQVGAVYNTTFSDELQIQNFFPLGGFLRLSGLARGEILGPHAALGRLVYYRRSGTPEGSLFEVPVYLGASLEAGNVWQNRSDMGFGSLIASGSLFAGFDTYLGPLFIGAGFAEGGRNNFYLQLGAPPR